LRDSAIASTDWDIIIIPYILL